MIESNKIILVLGENVMKKNKEDVSRALGVSEDVISKMNASRKEEKAMRDMQKGKIKTMKELEEKYGIGTNLDFAIRCKLESMASTWKRREEKKTEISSKRKNGEER